MVHFKALDLFLLVSLRSESSLLPKDRKVEKKYIVPGLTQIFNIVPYITCLLKRSCRRNGYIFFDFSDWSLRTFGPNLLKIGNQIHSMFDLTLRRAHARRGCSLFHHIPPCLGQGEKGLPQIQCGKKTALK
jgi:hypothetical protein